MIEVKNLTKYYGPICAVNNVSFEIKKGEVIGFIGPNGAGKSTTMRILTCYIPASSGSAKVAGYDVNEEPMEVRKRIGYLPENNPLYLEMTVSEYISFLAEIRCIKNYKHIFEDCGLTRVLHRYIGELSKGYRQRVGLAQALLHNPEILILDEPTVGLDPNQIMEIRKMLKNLGQDKTIILSTHILQEVNAMCNRVLIINNGEIVAEGTPDDLKKKVSDFETLYFTVPSNKSEFLTMVSKLEDVNNLEKVPGPHGMLRAKLETKEAFSLSEKIFKLAVENNVVLSELRRETVTLEDVFVNITAPKVR